MVARDPKALWTPVIGVGTAPFEGPKHPKGLIHTTEGFTIGSAMGSYRANGFAPHLTIGPDDPDKPTKAVRWQHLPYTGRSTTLADDSGGVRTNRLYVWQVEIVGTCDDAWKTRERGRYARWHVDNWPDWYLDAIADLMNDWEDWFGIPRRSSVTWRPYPSSYGQTSSRLSGSEFTAYEGWLGHQHAPENDHGDPGDLPIGDLFERMGGEVKPPPPVTVGDEDDLPTPEDVWSFTMDPRATADRIGAPELSKTQKIRMDDALVEIRARVADSDAKQKEQYDAVQEKLSAVRADTDGLHEQLDLVEGKLDQLLSLLHAANQTEPGGTE